MEAELKKYLKIEEEYWKKKPVMKWFVDGDRNTKFFHSYVKGRREKMHLEEISNEQGDVVQSNHLIGEAVVSFFTNQFMEDGNNRYFTILSHISKLINAKENEEMIKLPSSEEVKKVVLKLSSNSACGLDGFFGHFLQSFWEIIGVDITRIVRDFFCGAELPKFITHTNVVLLSKKEVVKTFLDMRPISLIVLSTNSYQG